jgi:hypothetical protein
VIKTPTTFVIGAGGSWEYSLPLGSELRDQARQLTPSTNEYQLLLEALGKSKVPDYVGEVNEFISDLQKTAVPSIDVFMEVRSHHQVRLTIGRAVIATLLGKAIVAKKGSKPNDWLGYIIARMTDGARNAEEFAQGNPQVRFVTFNFDSVIENRLVQELSQLFPHKPEIAIGAIPVRHVHGRFPPCPNEEFPDQRVVRGFPPEWISWVCDAAAEVKVIRDEISDESLGEARAAVGTASVVCFLGFSYHPENLRRLNIDPSENHRDWFGSANGFLEGEQARIKGRIRGIQLGGASEDSLAVLRKFSVFRDW